MDDNTRPKRHRIDWSNPDALAVDGFTVGEIADMALNSLPGACCPARCSECGAEQLVLPTASSCDCQSCGAFDTVTSPLVKLGIV